MFKRVKRREFNFVTSKNLKELKEAPLRERLKIEPVVERRGLSKLKFFIMLAALAAIFTVWYFTKSPFSPSNNIKIEENEVEVIE